MKPAADLLSHGVLALIASLSVLPTAHGAGFETLTHHWNFDEGPDWHDAPFQALGSAVVARDSVGAGHAGLQGMDGSAWVSGRQNTGLAFDGVDDSLLAAVDLSATLSGDASLSLWIRTTQVGTSSASTAPGLLGSGGIQWGWIDETGRLVLSLDGNPVLRSVEAVNDGRWHHLVVTREVSAGATQVFLDGQLSASATGPAGTRAGTITRLGQMQNGSPSLFQGRLDQIHLFSAVVDAATIQALYDNHAPKTWVVTSDGETSAPFSTDSVLVGTYAYDAEQDTLSVASFSQPAHGSASHNGDGSFSYTAASGYTGGDSFTVRLSDGRGGFTENTVNLLVTGSAPPGAGSRTTTFTDFQAIQAGGVEIALGGWRVPRAIDWDADGDLDLLIGDDTGIWRYQNTGTPAAPAFAAGVMVQADGADISLSGNILIALADMTGDGVDDLVAVNSQRTLRIYANTAAGQVPVYAAAAIAPSTAGGSFVLPDQRFDAADWDGDGLVDIVVGEFSGEVRAYRNVGSASAPLFDPADYEVLESGSYNLFPRVFDINLNGTPDYLRGINWGSINFWFDPSRYSGLGSQNGALTITYSDGSPVSMKPLTDGAMVDFADFNADGVLDILIGGHAGSTTHIAYGVANTVADSIAAIEAIYDAHPTGLGAALEADDQTLLNEIKAAEGNILMHMQAATLTEREDYFAALVTHVGNYAFLQMSSPVDTVEYHHLPSIAGQNLMTMHEMLPDTPAHRLAVADAVGLTGVHREIYLQMGLHVGDNQEATAGMIESVRDFMTLQPRESFPDAAITLNHYRGDQRGGWVSSFRGAKNTFDFGEGGNSTEWAGDLNAAAVAFYGSEVQRGDYFTFVMGHEVTHSLDGYISNRANKDLWRRKGQVLTLAAGPDVLSSNSDDNDFWDWNVTKARFQAEGHWDGDSATWDQAWADYWTTGPGTAYQDLSFMRGNIDWFLGASQEAMATQANHHWAHAEARLIGAIDRYQRGVAQGIAPMKANITEVLTFLDWISCGMNKIVMQDTEGVSDPYPHAEFHTTHAWVERDDNGYITKVEVNGRSYEFAVDQFGVVTSLVDTPAFQQDDEVSVIRNTPNLIKPLQNDQANGGSLVIDSFTQPTHGTLVDEGNGSLVYTPDSGFTGADSFTYGTGSTIPPSTVSILVMNSSTSQPGIRLESWTGIAGTAVSDLTSDPDFPLSPTTTGILSSFETASNQANEFGTRMTALLIPPTTDQYTFWIASDDGGELWLGSDRTRSGKALIASVSGWAGPRDWTKFASQQSTPITLEAGRPYYIETLHKEGSGGDNLAVAWQNSTITREVITNPLDPADPYLVTIDLNPPVVANPVPTVTVVEDAADTLIELAAVFNDPDLQDQLELELVGNSNPTLVDATLAGTQLTLSYTPGQAGDANLTLRAADLGGALATHLVAVSVLADHDGDGDPDTTDPDDDNDGIPDAWESSHGLDPLADDSAADPDFDGASNLDEYIADTDPADPRSKLGFLIEPDPGSGDPMLRFPSSPNRRYAVEFHPNLLSGPWQDLVPLFNGDGTEQIIPDPAPPSRRFYRLRVELP